MTNTSPLEALSISDVYVPVELRAQEMEHLMTIEAQGVRLEFYHNATVNTYMVAKTNSVYEHKEFWLSRAECDRLGKAALENAEFIEFRHIRTKVG